MGTGFTQDIRLTVTMEVRLRGDYAEANYPSRNKIADMISVVIRGALIEDRQVELLNLEVKTREI